MTNKEKIDEVLSKLNPDLECLCAEGGKDGRKHSEWSGRVVLTTRGTPLYPCSNHIDNYIDAGYKEKL